MPPFALPGASGTPIAEATATTPVYMFGKSSTVFEAVTAGEKSMAVALAPAVEQHGVRGFLVTAIWPTGTTAGTLHVQGADVCEDVAFSTIGDIVYPAIQYSSPSGLVVTFMRILVEPTAPPNNPAIVGPPAVAAGSVSARLMIR